MAYQSTPSPHSSLPDSPYTDTILSTSTHSEEALPPIITTPEEYSPAPLGRPNMIKVATDQSDPHSPSDSSAKPRSNLLSSDSRAHLQPQSLFRPNQARRRQSRFDPMIREEENVDEEAYGELGSRHPLRRVKEEEQERVEGISLPGIKALFGVAAGMFSYP
jgi:hypothetical protein